MKQAIKIAIENGWKGTTISETLGGSIKTIGLRVGLDNKEIVLLDPLFWQALGKGLGWNRMMSAEIEYHRIKDYPEWQWNMHRFIDHLAEGKDIDSFFNDLLK
ncbi:MAG: hypothetical protein WAV09_04105 [Minisyncoccia bacterium]